MVRVRPPRGGALLRREVVRHGPSVAILALDDRGRLLMERQYRYPVGARLWELPAGTVEPGESPLACARRELAEETGYSARRWRRLGRCFSSPGFVDEEMHLFLATALVPGQPSPEGDEAISLHFITPARFRALLAAGRIRDAKTLAGWALWQPSLAHRAGRDQRFVRLRTAGSRRP